MGVDSTRLEYATSGDPAVNYCLWEYTRIAPAEDKFRSVNLLFQSFEHAGVDEGAYAIVDAIRESIGPFRTVFGIKRVNEALAWELYFYDYRRHEREVSMSRVLRAIAPYVRCAVAPREDLPYFMFSLDIDGDLACGVRGLDVIHMYIGNPGSAVSSGIAYALSAGATTLENFYFFFDGASELDLAWDKIACSAYVDATRIAMDEVLLPELRVCQTICVANKRTHDCVYFSGIDVAQLLFFLERFAYPEPIVAFVRENRGSLDHLLFDVGVDYRVENRRVIPLKTGYYGVF